MINDPTLDKEGPTLVNLVSHDQLRVNEFLVAIEIIYFISLM